MHLVDAAHRSHDPGRGKFGGWNFVCDELQFATQGDLPLHGFARGLLWRHIQTTSAAVLGGCEREVRATFVLANGVDGRDLTAVETQGWPHKFKLVYEVRMTADRYWYRKAHNMPRLVSQAPHSPSVPHELPNGPHLTRKPD